MQYDYQLTTMPFLHPHSNQTHTHMVCVWGWVNLLQIANCATFNHPKVIVMSQCILVMSQMAAISAVPWSSHPNICHLQYQCGGKAW